MSEYADLEDCVRMNIFCGPKNMEKYNAKPTIIAIVKQIVTPKRMIINFLYFTLGIPKMAAPCRTNRKIIPTKNPSAFHAFKAVAIGDPLQFYNHTEKNPNENPFQPIHAHHHGYRHGFPKLILSWLIRLVVVIIFTKIDCLLVETYIPLRVFPFIILVINQ